MFTRLTVDDVSVTISRLLDKSSAANAFPVRRFKLVGYLLTPFLIYLFNRSFNAGRSPTSFKQAYITPTLEKQELPEADPVSYRPISNLPVVSKLIVSLVARQLVAIVEAYQLLPSCQSDFRRGHSTETAVTKMLGDLLDAVDRGYTTMLTLFDLSVAVDTVDRGILLDRLRVSFGVQDRALDYGTSSSSGPSSPPASAPVCSQCHRSPYASSSSIRRHHRCFNHFTLAAAAGAS